MLDSGYPANLDFGRAFQSASQFLRNIRKFHGKGSSILCWAVCESGTGQRGKYSGSESLLVEKAGLRIRGSSSGRLPARHAYDTENGHFRERGTRNEDAVRGRVQVRRCDLQPVIQQRQQIIGHNAFQCFSVVITKLHPQSVQLWPAKKCLALRFERVGKLAHEVDPAVPQRAPPPASVGRWDRPDLTV